MRDNRIIEKVKGEKHIFFIQYKLSNSWLYKRKINISLILATLIALYIYNFRYLFPIFLAEQSPFNTPLMTSTNVFFFILMGIFCAAEIILLLSVLCHPLLFIYRRKFHTYHDADEFIQKQKKETIIHYQNLKTERKEKLKILNNI